MIDLLDTGGRAALTGFLRPNTLIALDYDGTLAPIVARPQDATMRERTRELLGRVSRRFPVIILTGRSRADALRFLGGIPVMEVIGSHGLEVPGTAIARFLRRVEQWRTELAAQLRSVTGVSIENKRYSLAVHYRHADDPADAQGRIEQLARSLKGARLLGGKKVLNVVPEEAPHKGAALMAACERLGCPRAIYAGDDDTDEDVFALAGAEGFFTIRVGRKSGSAAGYFLRSQADVDEFLQAVLVARVGAASAATGRD